MDSHGPPRTSVVIPAHNEAATIDRCLDGLLAGAAPDAFEVVVVANGCDDDTAARARTHPGVSVLELPAVGKAAALNAGDSVVTHFPRIYLDADVVLTAAAATTVSAALASGEAEAAAPQPRPDTTMCSRWVRWYYDVWTALPVFADHYVGSGVYAVSARGHRTVAPFPDVVADDQYVRRRFTRERRLQVEATFDFHPARTIPALVHRSVRVQAGNRQLDARVPDLAPEESRRGLGGVTDLARDRPSLAPKLLVFLAVGALAKWRARRVGDGSIPWNQDGSAR